MPSFCNLNNRRGGQSLTLKSIETTRQVLPPDWAKFFPLSRLLAMLLVFSATSSAVFAGEQDRDRDKDRDRGHAIDPTGVWLQPNVQQVILLTFHRDGTYSADVAGESAFVPGNHNPGFQITSPTHALWQKTGAKTLAATSFAIQYNDDGSFYGLLKVRLVGVLNDSGDQMDVTISGGVFDLNGNLIPNPPLFRYWPLRTPTAGVPIMVSSGIGGGRDCPDCRL